MKFMYQIKATNHIYKKSSTKLTAVGMIWATDGHGVGWGEGAVGEAGRRRHGDAGWEDDDSTSEASVWTRLRGGARRR